MCGVKGVNSIFTSKTLAKKGPSQSLEAFLGRQAQSFEAVSGRQIPTLRMKKKTLSHVRRADNMVKVHGLFASEAAAQIQRSSILISNGICPTTLIQAWQMVECLTKKQLQQMQVEGPRKKRSNTSFRLHALDRDLKGYMTADLQSRQNSKFPVPGRFRLLFEVKKSCSVKCIGVIDTHRDARALVGGHMIGLAGKLWNGASIQQVMGNNLEA